MEQAVSAWSAARPGRALQALLLGVTPAVAGMRWPERSSLLAVDNSFPMTRAVWPGNIAGKRAAVCGNWLGLPLRESSCDVMVGDGSMNCLRYPDGFRALAKTAWGVLRKDGILVLRTYLQCAEPESPEELYGELARRSVGSFHAFKLRLLMALQRCPVEGIAVNRAYRSWMSRGLNPRELPQGSGWKKSAIETIEFYRETDTVYAFPTFAELRSVVRPYFEEVATLIPAYELGDRCPILVLKCRKPTLNPRV